MKIALTRPVHAHGRDLFELDLREPTGGDIAECGLPFESDGTTNKIDTKAVRAFIARLADIPPSSVDKLAPADWIAAMGVLFGFFGASPPATPSTAITNSPASSAM